MMGLAVARRHSAFLLLAMALLLAACSSSDDEPRLVCPRPAIIDELSSLERYTPGAAEVPEHLVYRAALQNISGNCRAEDSDILIDVAVETQVEPGLAFSGSSVELPYFVAVMAPGGEVLDRQDFLASIPVTPGAREAGSRESFSQRFRGIGPYGVPGYQVLFGFALPREEALRRAPPG
jgi:hypothetical protein